MLAQKMVAAALMAAAVPAAAQPLQVRPISGTRLDVVATGEVTRVPDIVLINAGISTQAPTAVEAIRANGAAMDRLREALRRAGIEPRDVQTSSVHLNAEWRHGRDAPPVFVGYRASHRLSVRFRDAANSGRILDSLVAAGANEIDGPTFEIAEADAARDEARTRAGRRPRSRRPLRPVAWPAGGTCAGDQRSRWRRGDGCHARIRRGPRSGVDQYRARRTAGGDRPDRQLRA
jgi:uncharacterized protein YggE